ncbi:MAG: 2-C-methyl-D-erythritol 2,4-cyclodiphosphate synthase, partial [Planctomycetes bacterium]|nr:2-C-methyl-D-erythritol 2,4-cyclodiphosphate synthase [Planctomycetota bacterium]
GTLFPNSDEAYRGVRSVDLAKQVARIIEENGFSIINLDVVLVCDQPVISQYRPKIRAGLAEAFDIDIAQVNVKGKTREGQQGRGNGVEAIAVALLIRQDQ